MESLGKKEKKKNRAHNTQMKLVQPYLPTQTHSPAVHVALGHTLSGRPDKAETTQTCIRCHHPSCRRVLGSKVHRCEAGKAFTMDAGGRKEAVGDMT